MCTSISWVEARPYSLEEAPVYLLGKRPLVVTLPETYSAATQILGVLQLKLAETYRAMVQDWYYKRRELAANMTYEIIDWVANKVTKKRMKSATWVVNGVNHYQYQVSDGQYIHEVNLQTGTCECRKWQLSRIPCGHVIAVTRFMGLTDCVQFVADWFKKDKYQGTYAESIHFLRNMQQWEFPHNIQKAIPP
ncbi:transposase, MuDR, MULE transposase domain protein [Tanacetum coccineum]